MTNDEYMKIHWYLVGLARQVAKKYRSVDADSLVSVAWQRIKHVDFNGACAQANRTIVLQIMETEAREQQWGCSTYRWNHGRSDIQMDSMEYWQFYLPDGFDTVEEVAELELRERLCRAIDTWLSDKEAEVMKQLYFAGASQNDLAADWGVTSQAVSAAHTKSLRMLREALQGTLLETSDAA